MVSIKTVLFSSAALLAAYMNVEAAVAPTYPSPGAVEKAGQPMEITWTFDGKDPDATYKIDFMTGSNTQQKKLATVATAVKANALKYSWTAPEVNPNAAIYFFMFTGSNGDTQWTTRFGISDADGKLTAEPETKQPDGEAIPWGNGALASGAAAGSSSVSASNVPATTPIPDATHAATHAGAAAAAAATTTTTTTVPVTTPSPVASEVSSSPVVKTAYVTTTVTKHVAPTPLEAAATAAQVAPATNAASSSMKPSAIFSTLAMVAVAAYFA